MTLASIVTSVCLATLPTADLRAMFDSTFKDFGNVARGSVAVHHFRLKNTTQSEIRISYLRSSCQCAKPSALSFSAKPGETLDIEVKYDTASFVGERSMTIDVTFEAPTYQTVTLRVRGFSRQDVVFNPGQVDFGVLTKGSRGERSAMVEYAGTLDWQITEVVPSTWFDAKAVEAYRQPGRVGYRVEVALKKEAPPGLIHEAIGLRTNDPASPMLQLQVSATIQAALMATPNVLDLGVLKVGEKATKRVVLKADRPFSIVSFGGATDGVSMHASQGARTVHVLSIEFAAPHVGKIDQILTVRTDLEGEEPLPMRLQAVIQ